MARKRKYVAIYKAIECVVALASYTFRLGILLASCLVIALVILRICGKAPETIQVVRDVLAWSSFITMISSCVCGLLSMFGREEDDIEQEE